MTSSQGGDKIEGEALTQQLERLIRAVREFLRRKKEARIGTLRAAVRKAEGFLEGKRSGEESGR